MIEEALKQTIAKNISQYRKSMGMMQKKPLKIKLKKTYEITISVVLCLSFHLT